jgi:predicted nucleotidyltransferase
MTDVSVSIVKAAQLPIKIDLERIAQFCQRRGIRRLTLFGSVLRDDFDPALSDIDVLAEFEPGALRAVGLQYFDYGHELGEVLGHRVDFSSRLHPAIRKQIENDSFTIYEQA